MAKTPGVGYDPRKFGLTKSEFITKGPPPRRETRDINFAEDPWAGGLTKEKFEKRFGAGSADRHKWSGFDNEHKINLVEPALRELFQSRPDVLQTDPAIFDGNPTAMEVEDCAATNHTSLVLQARSLLQWSGTPENPIVVSDQTKPERFTERSPLGLWDDNFLNLTPKPADPPLPPIDPPVDPPVVPPVEPPLPPSLPAARYANAFLEKVVWEDFLHYFNKRIAWPIAAALSRHPELQAEALEIWLHHVDAHPSGKTFLELKAKYGTP